ncbi:uncharacterized protein DS421_19g666640 [Arachis hypogaea]|uniref:Uncharacterized protein n=1 Tax=Arachis hypogaea TaxID=3818 RepID=A0A6B9VBU1_ARAHY|nr:uncharacterized protein DS421_19g666640 [Arachis hypogaea]
MKLSASRGGKNEKNPVTLTLLSKSRNSSVRAPIAAPFAATRLPRRALRFYRNNFIDAGREASR